MITSVRQTVRCFLSRSSVKGAWVTTSVLAVDTFADMEPRFWFDPCQACGSPVRVTQDEAPGSNAFTLVRQCSNPRCSSHRRALEFA